MTAAMLSISRPRALARPAEQTPEGAARRRTELGLIIGAAVLVTFAYVLASLGKDSRLPANITVFLAEMLGLMVCTHLAVRRFAPQANPILLPLALLLNGLGYVMIARLDQSLAALQSTWSALAVVVFVLTLALVRRARDLLRLRYSFGIVGLVLLVLPMVPKLGVTINGARLWVRVGGITFQPGEIVKVTLAIFIASYLVDKRELLAHATKRIGPLHVPDAKHFGPLILMFGVALGALLTQKDIGSSVLFMGLFVVMLWVGTGRSIYLILGGVLGFGGVAVAYTKLAYVQNRVTTWLNPWPSSASGGYQLTQGLFSMGSGGVFGEGFALGTPGRVPYAYNDFIFAAFGEELGLFGTSALLIAFLLFFGAGFSVAIHARDPFEKLLAAGLTTIVGLQAFLIMGGVVRLLPLTGIALPFVAYGGSSLMTNYLIVALLLRISHDSTARNARLEAAGVELAVAL